LGTYLQHTAADEGYLVAKTMRTGKQQIIMLPPPINASAADADDQKIIREEAVRAIAKRKEKLDNTLKNGFATVYDQCSPKVRDKLEASNDWDKTQREQSLHDLISKIKRICLGLDNHKQEVFNLVQALKTLFFCTPRQTEKASTNTRATLRVSGIRWRHSVDCRESTRDW
jgi:hypothetical protein